MRLRSCRVGAVLLSLLVTVAIAIAPNIAIAEPTEFQGNIEDSVRSLQKDAFMGVMLKRINDGSPLLDLDGTARQKRQQLNYDILSGADVPTHSLFDRFGGSLSFSYYLGEQVVRTGLPDKIYTVLNGTEWKDVSIKSVADIVSMTDTAYTNKFYKKMESVLELPDQQNLESVTKQSPESGAITKEHPATFPVYLPAEYIVAFTDKGDSVIEPFGG